MKITIKYFAQLREIIGIDQETIQTDVPTLQALKLELTQKSPAYVKAFELPLVRAAIDQTICKDWHTPLHDGNEVAFFPPVTGG